MKAPGLSILLIFVMSTGLFAGMAEYVKKDGEIYKDLKVSVAVKSSKSDTKKVLFTVEIGKVGKPMDFYLLKGKKNIRLKAKVKGGKVEVHFEIDKKDLKNSHLNFSYPDGSMCPDAYFLQLNDYFKVKTT